MWWWLRRICGGGGAGYVVGEIKNKANSAQLELELGLSLAILFIIHFAKPRPSLGGIRITQDNRKMD
jgi:hypothetical protein